MNREDVLALLRECRLCPRNCGVCRIESDADHAVGFCGAGESAYVSRSALHFWEEPCLSGTRGSGTVFFSGCNLRCTFCQNHVISRHRAGKAVTPDKLAAMFLDLQAQGAHNINLVTPTHYVPQIILALDIAKSQGLTLPVVYNCGGYELPQTIQLLDGYVDIWMPDFKYYDARYATRYSAAPDYLERVRAALEQMIVQAGEPVFDTDGMMRRGVIVRHLALPGLLDDSKRIIKELYRNWGDKIWISIMSQYTPVGNLEACPELNRRLDPEDYQELVDYACDLGITQAFTQEGESAAESFIPDFQ